MIGGFFDWVQYLPDLVPGLWVAVKLTVLTLLIGYPLGVVFAAGAESRSTPLRAVAIVLTEFGRGSPLLVLLYLVYQGGPQVGWVPSAMLSAVAAFSFSAAAYSAEIIRGALGSVPSGQREAAVAAGMSERDTFRLILAPQAARIAVPPLMGLAIQLFQLSSLAYLVTLPEVMQLARFKGTVTFDFLSVFVAAAVLYAAVTIPASQFVRLLEGRLGRHL